MAKVFKRGSVWYYDFRVNGRRYRSAVGPTKRIAERAMVNAQERVLRGELPQENPGIALNELYAKYVAYGRTHHSHHTVRHADTVYRSFSAYLETRSKASGNMNVTQITPEIIDGYKVSRRTDGARASTVNNEVKVLKALFNRAIRWGFLEKNPIQSGGLLRETDSKPPRFLSVEECKMVLEASSDDTRPIFEAFLRTGMRLGELVHLEWGDVDFRRRVIKIQRKKDWAPKSGDREIPMSGRLVELFLQLRQENEDGIQSLWVFPGRHGGRYPYQRLTYVLCKTADLAGVPDIRGVHTLRHTFASQLVMAGTDLPTVQKLLGHASIQTTMMYAHLAPDHVAGAVENISL